jgi:hypothetical protein
VIGFDQLQELGFTYREIDGQVQREYLHPMFDRVFAVGHSRVSPQGWLVAALLTSGPESFLSHRTAAAVWGLRPVAVKAIEVTIPVGHVRTRAGLIVHRTTDTGGITVRNDLRVSSVPRLLMELAPRESKQELDRLITLAVRKRVLRLDKVEDALARYERRPGVAKLRGALRGYLPRPDRKSELERAFDRELAKRPDIPDPARNVTIDGWEIDCYWPHQRVAVELDGRPYHVTVRDMEKDRVKDAKLQRIGIRPLRITDTRLELDLAGCFDDLTALLQLG